MLTSTLDLARQECQQRRIELEKLRDEKAQMLGEVSELKILLDTSSADKDVEEGEQFTFFLWKLRDVLATKGPPTALEASQDMVSVSESTLTRVHLNVEEYSSQFSSLSRPGRLTLLWPKVVFYPVAGLYLLRFTYASRDKLWQSLSDAHETIRGFWYGWVLTPLKDVINTVRTGGDSDEGLRIVTKDGLRADMEAGDARTWKEHSI